MAKSARRGLDGLTFLLLMALPLVAAWALTVTDWTDDLSLIPMIALLGVWAGTALARTRFPGWIASIFAAIYGVFVVGWQITSTMDPALSLHKRALSLLGRLAVFASVLISGDTNQDNLMFVLAMGLLFWSLGAFGAWSAIRRRSAWGAILPGGLTIAVIAYYYFGSARMGGYMAVYLLLSLLLVVRMEITRRLSGWSRRRARVPVDLSFAVTSAGAALAALLVLSAWALPAFARSERAAGLWEQAAAPLQALRERMSDAIGTLRGPVLMASEEYGERLELGTGFIPSDELVMEVEPQQIPTGGGRLYWRSRIYQDYEANGWTIARGQDEPFDPDQGAIDLVRLPARELIKVRVSPKRGSLRTLYLPAQPLWVDRTGRVTQWVVAGQIVDVLSFTADRYVVPGERYEALAAVASPTAAELRLAGTDYPDWVTQRYLQVPDSITPRTLELARAITEGLETPFDRAVAITRWLRDNIAYSRVIPAPPEGQEPLDWFLFDHRIGFCNFYASAEVIMLRSLGVPARLAAGYARGTYDAKEGVYRVMAEDSHAWPEVYFPGYGWVEFEPTVSQPVLTRPAGEGAQGLGGDLAGGEAGPSGGEERDRLEELLNTQEIPAALQQVDLARRRALIAAGVALALLLAALAWVRVDPLARITVRRGLQQGMVRLGLGLPATASGRYGAWETSVGRVYGAWSAWLERLGIAVDESMTPDERALAFASVVPEQAQAVWAIVRAYDAERFGGQAIDPGAVREAWRGLQAALWLGWLARLTGGWREAEEREVPARNG